LLVCDSTAVHPRAAPRLQALTRQAANDGLFRAERRLFLRLDGAGVRVVRVVSIGLG